MDLYRDRQRLLPQCTQEFAGKHVGLYFSAHWCGPCRQFTPQLIEAYKGINARSGVDFEAIFVSSDADEAAFETYYGEMPWLAIPCAEQKTREGCRSFFGFFWSK